MSNKRIDALLEEFYDRGRVVYQVVSPPVTYLVVELDYLIGTGYMVCIPEDEFSAGYGLKNALRKAMKNIYEQRRVLSAISGESVDAIMDYSDVLNILMPENDSFARLSDAVGTAWIIRFQTEDVSCVVTKGFMTESQTAIVEVVVDQTGHIILLPLRQLEVDGRRIIEEY